MCPQQEETVRLSAQKDFKIIQKSYDSSIVEINSLKKKQVCLKEKEIKMIGIQKQKFDKDIQKINEENKNIKKIENHMKV